MNENPYAAPLTTGSIAAEPTGAESLRRQYLNHEASVQSIGTLYLLGAIFMVPIGLIATIVAAVGLISGEVEGATIMVVLGVFYFGLGLLQGATALALWKLQTWARTVQLSSQ
ncbi:MAG: hypothetical protein CMJ64_13100 [Planctomycetaceae bacterium]|nr:hypothetical protein [Planctomycetaceae bacterium]